MAEMHVTLPVGGVGLHARPAAVFVGFVSKSTCEVTVGRPGGPMVNAKSILSVMGLGAEGGDEIVLHAQGDGADDLLASLKALLETPEGGHA